MLALILALATPVHAQDYKAAAEEMMGLEYNLDEVDAKLRARKMPAPRAAAPAMSYDGDYYVDTPVAGQGLVAQAALPLEPNSDVDTVVVFSDRALVTRQLKTTLKPGAGTVDFVGLPLGLAA